MQFKSKIISLTLPKHSKHPPTSSFLTRQSLPPLSSLLETPAAICFLLPRELSFLMKQQTDTSFFYRRAKVEWEKGVMKALSNVVTSAERTSLTHVAFFLPHGD